MRLFVAASGTNWLFRYIVNSFPVGDIAIFIVGLDFSEGYGDIIWEELFASEKLLQVRIVREGWIERRLGDAGQF